MKIKNRSELNVSDLKTKKESVKSKQIVKEYKKSNDKVVKINIDHIHSRDHIIKRCKFVINNLHSISKYEIEKPELKEKYWQYTFWYRAQDKSVNFYWIKANKIVDRAIAKELDRLEQLQF